MGGVDGIAERQGVSGSVRTYYRPTPLETTISWLLGFGDAPSLPEADEAPLRALEAAVLSAMQWQPCFVSFSGGRDSSAVLAVASAVARREGLPPPIPATLVYPGIDEADESVWQRRVIDHLGLSEWLRISITGEQDLVGPTAQAALRRRGLVYPASIQLQDPLWEQVAGGSLLTGEGGDELLGARRITPATIMIRNRARPSWDRIRATAIALAPRPVRRNAAKVKVRREVSTAWLSAETTEWVVNAVAADEASEPLRWDDALVWLLRRRAAMVLADNYRLAAADHDVTLSDPLMDPGFVASLRRWGGVWGFRGRTAIMRRLFGDLLPYEVISRSSKAYFNRAYFGPDTREFARRWTGGGVDPALVDAERLRAEWLSDTPSGLTALMLQAAWLHDEGLGLTGDAQ